MLCFSIGAAFLCGVASTVLADHLVFVSDGTTVRVLDIATLSPVAELRGNLNVTSGGFDDGHHMVVDSLGQRIFVSDHDEDFMVFDYNNSCLVPAQVPWNGISLREPLGIAPLPNGQLLITDEDLGGGSVPPNNGLFRLNADLSENLETDYTGLDTPEGVAYDAVHDRIYVADEDDDQIEIFNGTTLAHIATINECAGDAYWLGVDGSSNRLFVLSGNFCSSTTQPQSLGIESNRGIQVYDITDNGDNLVFNQTIVGSEGGGGNCYGALAVSESTDRLFAIDYCSNTVDIFDTLTLAKLGTVPSNGENPLMVGVGDLEIVDCNANLIPDDCEIKLAKGPIVYFVFEDPNTRVFRLQDLNDDGDANDPGEGWLYGNLDDSEGIDVDQRNGDLYVCQTDGLIYRYRDLNGDGDALDAGEKFLYADDISSGIAPNEASLENIAVGENNNTIYTVYENEDAVVWHRDMNNDGDALDAGEFGVFANVGCDLEEITVDASTGDVYVGSDNHNPFPQLLGEEDFCIGGNEEVWRLVDVNGDNDAEDPGDIKELIADAGHEALDFNDNSGELFAGEEDFDHFHRVVGGVETTYGELDCCGEALAVDPISGDVFTGDEFFGERLGGTDTFFCGLIQRFRDLNGDNDAVDEGERTLFHDFLFNENFECETEALAAYGGRDIDCNNNGIPDECDPDCDGDGIPDDCDTTPETEAPVITGCHQSISGSLDANCNFPAPDLQVDATDNCTATEDLVVTIDPADLSSFGLGENVVTITVTDAAGNSTSCTVTITLEQGDCDVGGDTPPPQPAPCDPSSGGINILLTLLFHAPVCGMGCPLMMLLTLCGMVSLKIGLRRRRWRRS